MKKIVTTSLFIFCISTSLWSQLTAVQQKAIIVKRMMELNHFSPRPVDDSFSVVLFNKMINTVDRGRKIFY